jgi:hypothetical protein
MSAKIWGSWLLSSGKFRWQWESVNMAVLVNGGH